MQVAQPRPGPVEPVRGGARELLEDLFKTLAYALVGARRLLGRVMRWWHWGDGWQIESHAVAAGRAGHADALRAHMEGKKTRGTGGRSSPSALPRPPPTLEIITRALGSLNISAISKAIESGRGLNFVSDVHRDGEGWGCDLDLPHGVTPRITAAPQRAAVSTTPTGSQAPDNGHRPAHRQYERPGGWVLLRRPDGSHMRQMIELNPEVLGETEKLIQAVRDARISSPLAVAPATTPLTRPRLTELQRVTSLPSPAWRAGRGTGRANRQIIRKDWVTESLANAAEGRYQ